MQTRYKTNGIVLLGLCLLAAAATASARLDIEWARIWGAPVNDYGQGIDMSGGSTMIYVAGQTFGSFDGATAVSGVGDACMSAYLQDGTRSWTRIWGSSGTDNAKGVAVDPGSGDIYVVGYTDGSFGGQTNQGMVDAFCSKFDSTGALLWTRIWGSDKDDYAEAVVVGAGGKVYVAGWTYGAFDGQTNNGLSDIFVSCISETGDRDWSMIWGSTVQDECRDITLYPTVPEQVFVTGWTMGAFDGQPHFGLGDIFLSNIDVGIPMRAWSRIWGSSLDDQGACVTMDMPGYAVYVAGHTAGAIGTGQSNAGGADFVLSRLSIGGTMMWSKTWGSPEDDSAIAARCEMFSPSNSAVMVVGNTYGSFASQINPMPGHSAFAMSAINETGGMDSAYIWGSTSDDSAKAVVVDGACNVYVAGYTDGSFGGQTNHGLYDMALTRFSPAMPGDRFVAPGGAHIWPYDTWANAATTIHEAVMAAFTGDTVYISNGVYMLDAPIVLMEEVNLTGVNGPEVTIIDGDGSNRCVEINNTGSIVYGLTLRNGYDTTSGGGLQMTGGRVRRCAIKGCQATYGGGVYMSGGEVQNCLIANNDASMMGGGVYQGSGGFISSCTIAGNSSISQAGGMYASGGSVVNTIVDGNSAPTDANIYNSSTTPAIFDHCCSVPVMPGVANVTGPAQFVNPGGYDFTLVNASPCVDRGTNALWMDAETDLGGHPRIINSIVDMGSFEYMNVPTSFVVSAVQGGHGTILPTQEVVSAGGTVVFNIYPDIGYEVLDVLVNNQSIGPTNQYTFVNVMSNQILGATYTAQMFNIISTSAVNGVITPPTAIVPYGGGETFLISPNPGFVIADVFVDGFSVGITSNYTFTNVTDDRTIAALFSTNVPTYTIAASTTPGGTILPPSALVTAGNSQSFSIIPDAGYHIVDVFVDSTAIGAVTSYTFNSVYSDHSIAASFSTNMTGYHISTIAGANGQISPIEANVPPGGSQNFTIEPDPGYVIRGVRVNGVFIGQTNTYLFTDVNSNQLIAASFIAATTTYEIAAAAGAHGRVNPSNAVVTAGGSHTVTITPDAGFFVRDVTVDGSSVGAVPYFVFDDVFDNHHLFASFDTTGPGSLSGQVVAGAMVLSNAHVELRNSANVTVYDAFTDHAGHYSITGINPGGYRVKAGHAAYADVWYDGGSGSHYIASAAVYQIFGGMTSQSLDFSLAPGQSPALVDVWSSPTGLPVYLDFLSTGLVTPAVVALGEANGIEHTVWVKGDGLPWPAPVGVAGIEAETERVDFTLASSPVGYLEVTTSPDGAEVYLDHTDAPAGVTPCGPFALAPGTHVVIIRKDECLVPWPIEVEIEAGVTRTVDIPLTKKYIFRDDFGGGFGAWELFGSPQSRLVDAHGRQGVFDNNGDAVCDSGIITRNTLDIRQGCVITADVYLEVIDPRQCWVHGAIALSSGQESTGFCDTYENIGLIEFAMIGEACTEIPAELRGHSYIWGPGMEMTRFDADPFVNGWHTLRVEIDSGGAVALYIDEQYIGEAPYRIDADLRAGARLVLGRRSSGAGGKFYMDDIVVKPDIAGDIIHVRSEPDAATIYLDYLPVHEMTDAVLDGFDPLSFHGDGWQGVSHRVILSKLGYVHTAPRAAPPDVSVALVPAVGHLAASLVFRRVMDDQRDLDGDAVIDVSCYDPGAGMWYMRKSRGGYADRQFGFGGTIPVAGDFDGDGIQDITVYWPEGGCWYILRSSDDTVQTLNWGWSDVWPTPGDYDGDGKTDIAVYWPEAGAWYIRLSESGATRVAQWGWDEVMPVPADYDGDGYSDVAVYWPEGGMWYILQSALQEASAVCWGWADAQPVPADFDGDGRADIAVFWPRGGNWFILQSDDGCLRVENWGWNESLPVSGDYDGDGKADITVYWPGGAYWYLFKSRDGVEAISLGENNAMPVR